MKKSIVLFFLLLVSVVSVRAQYQFFDEEEDEESDYLTKIAVVIGGNRSSATDEKNRATPINSLSFGVVFDWLWLENFYLQPGLMFVPKGYESYRRQSSDTTFNYKLRAYYLEIPLTVAYKYPINRNVRLFADAGAYFSIGLFGKIREDDVVWEKVMDTFGNYKNQDMEQLQSYDMGWQLGGGVELYDRVRLRVGYERGFLQTIKNFDSSQQNTMWSLSVGYYFHLE
ncbi:MAG: porin family protein [Bacteroidales bacterium]|nr:porin family protein [Bacteroidales bacterium]MDD4821483.1 porin family protein [Bacteroidales bacterium]